MSPPLILDAEGLDALSERTPPERLRDLLAEARHRRSEVLVPALVCAECCRGASRTRAVEAALSRSRRAREVQPAVRVVPTDFNLARLVGAILYDVRATTADVVDAHSVAVAALYGGGVVVTADPDDIHRLATAVPTVRVVTRRAW